MKKLLVLILLTFSFALQAYECPNDYHDPCLDDSDLFRKCEKVTFINGEFLYWKANQGNLEYAFQYDQDVPVAGYTYGTGKFKESDYDWKPGFRLALGWFNAPHYWQVYGQFTWMRITGSNSSERTSLANQPLVGTFAQNGVLSEELKEARSDLKLNHELGDFLVSRVFIPSPHFRLRLFGGFTGGRIKQRWNVDYISVNSNVEKIFNRFSFVGVGYRLGIDLDWFFGKDFYLSGKASVAQLVGKYKNLAKIDNISTGTIFENSRYNQWRAAYNVQFYLGPSYQRAYCSSRFELFAGYEINSWFNILEVIRNTGASSSYLTTEQIPRINNGALLMHGLTARFTIDF
ncbi:MAG: hypothetical protein JXA94_03955 [Parachlamydiales bacterium]|nr:hypothetical protein [Parachlamydiales bacterium]